MRNGRSWGEDVNLLPGWEKIQKAAVNAVTAPETWVPLSSAFIIHVTNNDYKIANWATHKNPIFGSQNNADRFTDYFLPRVFKKIWPVRLDFGTLPDIFIQQCSN